MCMCRWRRFSASCCLTPRLSPPPWRPPGACWAWGACPCGTAAPSTICAAMPRCWRWPPWGPRRCLPPCAAGSPPDGPGGCWTRWSLRRCWPCWRCARRFWSAAPPIPSCISGSEEVHMKTKQIITVSCPAVLPLRESPNRNIGLQPAPVTSRNLQSGNLWTDLNRKRI